MKVKVGFIVFANWIGYSSVKNFLVDGLVKFKFNGLMYMVMSGEFEFYELCVNLLCLVGVDVFVVVVDVEFNGMKFFMGLRVVFGLDVVIFFDEFKLKVGVVKLGVKSVFVVEGFGVNLKNVEVDGAFVIKACEGAEVIVDGLKVMNKGW